MNTPNTVQKFILFLTLMALTFSASLAFSEDPTSQTPISRIPWMLAAETTTFFYLRNVKDPWQQLKHSEFSTRLGDLKVIQELWESSEVASVFKEMARFGEIIGIKLTEENLLNLVGEEICLASISPSGSDRRAGQGLIILKVSPLVNLMARITGPLMTLMGSNAITSEEFEGITLSHFQGIYFAIIENYALLSDSQETLKQQVRLVLGKQTGTLEGDARFREISEEMKGDYHGFVYHKIGQRQEEQTLGGRVRNLLLDDIEAVAVRIKFKDSSAEDSGSPIQITWKAFYTQEGREKGLGKFRTILPASNVPVESLKSLNLIPADTVFYLASPRFSSQLYYSYFLKNWFNNPEELVTHGRFLNKIEASLGLDSKEGSVPFLGKEVAIAGTGVGFNGAQLYLKLIGLLQADPRDAALNLGDKLFQYIFGEPVNTMKKKDVEVHYVGTYRVRKESQQNANQGEGVSPEVNGEQTTPGGNAEVQAEEIVESINPSYGYLSGYLVVARDLDTLESVINAEGKLSENKGIQVLFARKSDPHWVLFISTERLMDALGGYITDLAEVKSNYVYQDAKARLVPLTEALKTLGDIQGWLAFGENMVEGKLEMME